VKPVVVYGSETWAMSEMDMKRQGTGKRNILRIHGPVVQKVIWRIRTNHELRKLYKDLHIVAYIKKMIGTDWTCSKKGSGKDS